MRMILLASLLLCILSSQPGFAITPFVRPETFPTLQQTRLDDLHFDAISARLDRRFSEATDRQQEILGEFPGDGVTLREIALSAQDQGGLPALIDDLADLSSSRIAAGPGLSEADRAFVRGMSLMYLGRVSSAEKHFQRVVRKRPGWAWGQYYLAPCHWSLGRSSSTYSPGFRVALESPDTFPDVIEFLFHQRKAGAVIADDAATLRSGFKHAATIPRTRLAFAQSELVEELNSHPVTPESCEEIWQRSTEELGPHLARMAPYTAWAVRTALPVGEALEFFERRAQEGVARHTWVLNQALLHRDMGRPETAVALLNGQEELPEQHIENLLGIALEIAPVDELRSRVQRYGNGSTHPLLANQIAQAFDGLGQPARAESVRTAASKENPFRSKRRRLYTLWNEDVPAGAAQCTYDRETGNVLVRFSRREVRTTTALVSGWSTSTSSDCVTTRSEAGMPQSNVGRRHWNFGETANGKIGSAVRLNAPRPTARS